LTIRLEQSNGTLIETGNIPESSVSTSDAWVTYSFLSPRTLSNGITYNLELNAPSGDAYQIYALQEGGYYGLDVPHLFKDGHAEFNNGSGWSYDWRGSNRDDFDFQLYFTLAPMISAPTGLRLF